MTGNFLGLKRVFSSALAAAQEFSHDVLHDPSNIRVVYVEPGQGSQPITCNIVEISIGDVPYEALSYTWGSKEKPYSISCNGAALPVTKNLYEVLHRLRDKDQRLTFWIDQMSINQENISERNSQVAKMDEIYREAARVVIWIGSHSKGSKRAVALARKILNKRKLHCNLELTRENLHSYGLPSFESSDWLALKNLFCRPYFKRVWVVQEVSFARDATVLCGDDSLLWSEVCQLAYQLHFAVDNGTCHGATQMDETAFSDPICTLQRFRNEMKSNKTMSLLRISILVKSYEATDPRDKVFAFLHLGNYDMMPDYGESVQEVYLDAAKQCLAYVLESRGQNGTSCKFSHMLSLAGISNRLPDLPSWVPDLSTDHTRKVLFFSTGDLGFGKFGISNIPKRPRLDNNALLLRGRITDTIQIAGACSLDLRPNLNSKRRSQLSAVSKWLEESNRLSTLAQNPYPTGEHSADVYKYTIQAGNFENHQDVFCGYVTAILNQSPISLASLRWQYGLTNDRRFHSLGMCAGRVFCVTGRGLMGLVPHGTASGDLIVRLDGTVVPFVLRPKGADFTLIGEAYVHGAMTNQFGMLNGEERDVVLV